MRTAAKAAVLMAGYAAAVLLGFAAAVINYALSPGDAASSGMHAFGDLLVFVGVTGLAGMVWTVMAFRLFTRRKPLA